MFRINIKMNKLIACVRKKYNRLDVQTKAMVWYSFSNILQKGVAIIGTPIFTRIMTQGEYGITTVFQSWMNILTVIVTLNLSYGVFNKGIFKYKDRRDEYTASMQGLNTCLAILFFFIFLIFQNKFILATGLSKNLWLFMFVLFLVTPAFDFWSARQRFEYKYVKLVLISAVNAVGSVMISVIAICYDNTAATKIIFTNVILIIISAVLYVHTFRKGKCFYIKEYWVYALNFNIPLIPHYLSLILLSHSDRIMIQYFLGAAAAGMYSVANQIAAIANVIKTAVGTSLTPYIYERLDRKEFPILDKKIFKNMVYIAILVTVITGMAPEIMKVFAQKSYYNAVLCVPPLVFSVFAQRLYENYVSIEYFLEKTKFSMVVSLSCTGINIVLNDLMIPYFGYMVCAYTTAFSYILMGVGHMLYADRICRKVYGKIIIQKQKYLFLFGIVLTTTIGSFAAYGQFMIRYLMLGFILLFYIMYLRRSSE